MSDAWTNVQSEGNTLFLHNHPWSVALVIRSDISVSHPTISYQNSCTLFCCCIYIVCTNTFHEALCRAGQAQKPFRLALFSRTLVRAAFFYATAFSLAYF
jgi:hypothetical protein